MADPASGPMREKINRSEMTNNTAPSPSWYRGNLLAQAADAIAPSPVA
jgi:hypothetical protein